MVEAIGEMGPARRRRSGIALLLVGCGVVLCVALGLYWAALRVDALAAQRQQTQVLAALDEYRERIRVGVAAELHWDEAVERLDNAFDPEWAQSHLSSWLGDGFGIERIVLFDAADRPTWATVDREPQDPAATAAACDVARPLRELRAREAERGPLPPPSPTFDTQLGRTIDDVDFGFCDGMPVAIIAHLVQPDFGRALPREPRAPIAIVFKRLDGLTAAHIETVLVLDDVRIDLPAPAASSPDPRSVLVRSSDGTAVARIGWRADRPGRILLRDAAPFAAVSLAGLLGLALIVVMRMRRDATMLLAAAARAQRQAESLERMSALSGIGAWEASCGSEYVELSRESARILEVGQPGTHLWRDARRRLDPRSIARLEAALADTGAAGGDIDLLVTTAPAAGPRRTLRIHGRATDAAGRRTIEGTIEDISDRLRLERDRRRNTELLERMSRIANIGGWEYDVATDTLTFTAQAYRIYGLPVGRRVTINDIAAMYSPDDAERILKTIGRAARDGTSWELDLSPTTADGRRIWVRGLGESEVIDGRLVRLFGTLQDTTAAHDAATRLGEAMVRLEQRNAEIQQFTFAASHDLQEPARKLQALGSLLLSRHGDQLDAHARDCVIRMQRSAERMSSLIDDVLAFSRAALKPVASGEVPLETVAREVVEDLDAILQDTGGQVQIGALPRIEGDRGELRRLLQNLLANAVKYRHPERPPRITVTAETFAAASGDEWCRLIVEDNGSGFEPRFAEKIFLPFKRLDPNRAGAEGGSGLGLAIVRRIAERHGGRVRAEGQLGVGARFFVELPRTRDRASAGA